MITTTTPNASSLDGSLPSALSNVPERPSLSARLRRTGNLEIVVCDRCSRSLFAIEVMVLRNVKWVLELYLQSLISCRCLTYNSILCPMQDFHTLCIAIVVSPVALARLLGANCMLLLPSLSQCSPLFEIGLSLRSLKLFAALFYTV